MAAVSFSVPGRSVTGGTRRGASTGVRFPRARLRKSKSARMRTAVALAVLAWLVVFVGAGIGASGAADTQAGDTTTVLSSGRTHRVEAGETLWSIAARSGADGDPREVVAEIVSLNHLSGSSIAVGQVLTLP